MNYATNFAIVKNGTVTNLLRGLVYNTMDDFPNAVHTENLDVQIGDTYENGVFMRDGQVVTGGNVGVQSDWNQNDNTQPDYVKNRPFYTGDPVETVLVEENTASFTESGSWYMAEFPSTFAATVGETYSVSWDGTVYECTCVSFNNVPVIGNLSVAGAGSDTGEPFLMVVYNGTKIEIYTTDTSASHTFSIVSYPVEVVKIDANYLPVASEDNYGVVKKSDIVSVYNLPGRVEHDKMLDAITAFKNGNARIVWGGQNVIEAWYRSSVDTISVAFANNPLNVITFSNIDGFYNSALGEERYGEVDVNIVRLRNDSALDHYCTLTAEGELPDMTLSIGAKHISLGAFEIANQKELYLTSSTANSSKRFKITVDDSGTISATEVS